MKKSENILILGLGGMGRYLARRLSADGHQVTAIERDAKKLARVEDALDARLIQADALDWKGWRDAHAEQVDYVIAVTDDDAVNILAGQIAHRLGKPKVIARVREVALWEDNAVLTAEDLQIDLVIRPEELVAQEITRLLKRQAGNLLVNVGDGDLQVMCIHVKVGSPLSNVVLSDLSKQYADFRFQVVAVARDIETILPGGDFRVRVDDHVYLLVRQDRVPELMKLGKISKDERHRVLIVGGGLVGSRTAELLQSSYEVRLLERDEARAEHLQHALGSTEVLHGDGSVREVLLQAGLLSVDTIVTATRDNATNIMTSVLAKHLIHTQADVFHRDIGKTIALVESEHYSVLASAMGTDIAVDKKILAANEILRFLRRGRVLSVGHLHGCDAEVVELVPDPSSRITRRPLKDLHHLAERIRVGAYFRAGSWEVARGKTQLAAGDRVVCICRPDHLGELQSLFLA